MQVSVRSVCCCVHSLSPNRKHVLWQHIMVSAATKPIMDKARDIVQRSQEAVVAENLLKESSSIVGQFSSKALSKSSPDDFEIDVILGQEGAEIIRTVSLKLTEYVSKCMIAEPHGAWSDNVLEPLKNFQSAVKHLDDMSLPQKWAEAMQGEWHELSVEMLQGLSAKHEVLCSCNEACKDVVDKLQASVCVHVGLMRVALRA